MQLQCNAFYATCHPILEDLLILRDRCSGDAESCTRKEVAEPPCSINLNLFMEGTLELTTSCFIPGRNREEGQHKLPNATKELQCLAFWVQIFGGLSFSWITKSILSSACTVALTQILSSTPFEMKAVTM